jgi:ParB family chromosome partitioning protein
MRSDRTADHSSQVAENQKRHGLSPLEMARFVRVKVEAGDSNATIARQLGMNLTTVSHHPWLLGLPPVLDSALKTGRCTSARTLHELSKLHDRHPARVEELLDGSVPITRDAPNTLRAWVDAISTDGTALLIG